MPQGVGRGPEAGVGNQQGSCGPMEGPDERARSRRPLQLSAARATSVQEPDTFGFSANTKPTVEDPCNPERVLRRPCSPFLRQRTNCKPSPRSVLLSIPPVRTPWRALRLPKVFNSHRLVPFPNSPLDWTFHASVKPFHLVSRFGKLGDSIHLRGQTTFMFSSFDL